EVQPWLLRTIISRVRDVSDSCGDSIPGVAGAVQNLVRLCTRGAHSGGDSDVLCDAWQLGHALRCHPAQCAGGVESVLAEVSLARPAAAANYMDRHDGACWFVDRQHHCLSQT